MSGLLPTHSIKPGSAAASFNAERAVEIAVDSGVVGITRTTLADCWVVAGRERAHDESTYELFGTVFWCPDAPQDHQYIDVAGEETAGTFTTVLRRAAARMIW